MGFTLCFRISRNNVVVDAEGMVVGVPSPRRNSSNCINQTASNENLAGSPSPPQALYIKSSFITGIPTVLTQLLEVSVHH